MHISKKWVIALALIWLVILVAGVTTSVTLAIAGSDSASFTSPIASAQDVVVSEDEYRLIQRYARLDEVLQMIQREYYLDVDEDTLILGAIHGMVGSLGDIYSYYETPDDVITEQEHQLGTYRGVGLQLLLTQDYEILITRVFKDSPSEMAGFRAGDIIVAINDDQMAHYGAEAIEVARSMLIGAEAEPSKVTVRREDTLLTLEVMPGDVIINRVESCMLTDDIGYIAIYEFLGDDVNGFATALTDMQQNGAKGLIIDIRSNPGGLLYDVVRIADLLLDEGLIVYVENRNGERDSYYSDADALGLPLVVLVNGNSASASEILAGAVQDRGAGVIIGETTYGKGIVQSILSFPSDGAGLHLTTARYFTPNGRSIHGTGIEPDIVVPLAEGDDITQSTPDATRDSQLRAALDYLEEALVGDAQ